MTVSRMGPLKAFAAACLTLLLTGCGADGNHVFQGYAEGEYVRVAAPFAGNLTALNVTRGNQVKAGAPLFVLEQENEAAARREAEERVRVAAAQLENLKKGKRVPELDAIKAQLAQAEASLRFSRVDLKRQQELVAAHFISKERLDGARAAYDRDNARVAELSAQLRVARLAARADEIGAAEAELAASRAALAQAEWKLAQKSVKAPLDGLVSDTIYVQGEWVPAGSPVVSLLPPQNIKVRFFVPETALGQVKVGQAVSIACDGCKVPIRATVSFISPQAEYTPPVIYSKESRAKLVFLLEARPAPEDAARLHPGQPFDVRLQP